MRRSEKKDKYPGYWEIPGGRIEAGEEPEECIRREIREELNLEITRLEEHHVDMSYREGKRYIVFVFTGEVSLGGLRIDADEVAEYRLARPASTNFEKLYPRVAEQVARYREALLTDDKAQSPSTSHR